MPDLLLELFSEEIPARMQRKASEDLQRLVTDGLVNAGLTYEGAKAYATPRRLTLTVVGLPVRSPEQVEEKKGPRVGAPEGAIAGFLKGAGLTSIDQATIVSDPKKGDFYVARANVAGKRTVDVVSTLIPGIIRSFPWPKSQTWGSGTLRWVRPLHTILCTFGPETEEPEVVHFDVDGIVSANLTKGHRFHAPDDIVVKRFDDYVAKLEKAHVVLDPARRRDIILNDARDLALAQGLELIEDEGLTDEVSGLVEWPIVLVGEFEREYLTVPGEVIRATIRANQKCFVLRDPATGGLANKFILVANIAAKDGGKAIAAGNGRVIRARLSDARHFYETDLKSLPDYGESALKPLDQRLDKMATLGIVFHEKLGTQIERIARIETLARTIAAQIGAEGALAGRAARLAKADLLTEVVGEFPELQGLMGRYYALAQDEDPAVAAAIEDHYKPQGPSDRTPTDPVAIAVALADKIDTLVGFWAIDEKPTGSKDPYQLRRATLGVIRIIMENGLRLRLSEIFLTHHPRLYQRASLAHRLLTRDTQGTFFYPDIWHRLLPADFEAELVALEEILFPAAEALHVFPAPLLPAHAERELAAQLVRQGDTIIADRRDDLAQTSWRIAPAEAVAMDLIGFFAERLKVQLREQGARHDLVDAVFGLSTPDRPQDDLIAVTKRIDALAAFLEGESGQSLLAGYRRAVNILRAEEKKDGRSHSGTINLARLVENEELALAKAISGIRPAVKVALESENFAAAMTSIAGLREPVDAFFDKILVNADDPAIRENRLRLLSEIRDTCHQIADFSRIAG